MKCRSLLAGTIVIAASASLAAALPITYQLSGTGTGTVGATPFTNATFTMTLTTDTTLIAQPFPGIWYTPETTATIDIAGIGLATFTSTKHVFSNTNSSTTGVGFSDPGAADICDMRATGLNGYQLMSPIGPVSSPSLFPVDQFINIGSDLGDITFTSYQDGTFTAVVNGGAAIPTASTAGLAAFAVMLLAFGAVALRRLT